MDLFNVKHQLNVGILRKVAALAGNFSQVNTFALAGFQGLIEHVPDSGFL